MKELLIIKKWLTICGIMPITWDISSMCLEKIININPKQVLMSSGKSQYYIDKLELTRHPEGGAFKETYRSELIIPKHVLPASFQDDRNASTTIYFLLEHGQFSAFHQIASDEGWHF